MKVQLVTPYRVSHLQRYGVTVRGNVTNVYPPLEWEMLQRTLQRISKHTLYVWYVFFNNRAIYEIMWKKYGRAGQAIHESAILRTKDALFMPDSQGKNTDTHS